MCTAQMGLKWLSCTPGSHSVCAIRTLSGVNQKILTLREPILRALVAQTRCPEFNSPFHFPLYLLLNIYNFSLFQHEARHGKVGCVFKTNLGWLGWPPRLSRHAFSIQRTLASCWNLDVMRRRWSCRQYAITSMQIQKGWGNLRDLIMCNDCR